MFALALCGKRSLKIKIVRFATGGEPKLTSGVSVSARWCVPEPHELLDPDQRAVDVHELHDRARIAMLHAHDSEPIVLPP